MWRKLIWLVVIGVFVGAIHLAAKYEVADRLMSLFLSSQAWLLPTVSFEQFLIILTVASFLLVLLAIAGCVVAATVLSARHQRKMNQIIAVRHEMDHLKEQQEHQYQQFLTLGQTLTRQLDKPVLVQNIIEATSRLCGVPQANGIVRLWLLQFETDTFKFERGLYCEETMFTQAEFQPSQLPFARVVSTKQPWVSTNWEEGLPILKKEKASRLGSATGDLLVPLVIEGEVLGVLAILCHPDVLKLYEAQQSFFHAQWGQLSLALAIAIQGEVTILDRLTGVHNREYFMKRLVQEVERSNRFRLPLSLLMIDIDNFKLVNDMLGHQQGDAVLKIIAKIIKKAVRAIDLVGRYGGEEFIVMLPETGYGEDAASATSGAPLVAERMRKAVDDEFRGLQKPLNLTVSVGVACRRFPEDRDQDYKEIVRLADQELYRAKTGGKNKVCVLISEKIPEAPNA